MNVNDPKIFFYSDTNKHTMTRHKTSKKMKEGKCKCGEKYLYIGLDLGLCTKCLDSMEDSQKNSEAKK